MDNKQMLSLYRGKIPFTIGLPENPAGKNNNSASKSECTLFPITMEEMSQCALWLCAIYNR